MLLRYLKSDLYKMKKSKIFIFHLIIPIALITLFLVAHKVYKINEYTTITGYMGIITIGFPVIIATVINFIYETESQDRFQSMLRVSGNRIIPHLSKFIIIFILSFISISISILGFGIIFLGKGLNLLSMNEYLDMIIILFLTNIILYMLQYCIVMKFGKAIGLWSGIVGSLLVALMETGLGDGIWFFLPWGYSVRIVEIFLAIKMKIIENTGGVLNKELIVVIVFMMIWIIIIGVFIYRVSKRWEGVLSE